MFLTFKNPMEINRWGGEQSSENELESSTLAYCSYYCVVSHPSDPVRALNPMVTYSFVNHPLGSPSLSQRCWQTPRCRKAFTFKWEISAQLCQRSKSVQEKDESAVKKLAGGDGQ